jgi:hypothetical protein
MNKSTFFSGQPIFTQLLRFIPKDTIFRIARQYNADRYCITNAFTSTHFFVIMSSRLPVITSLYLSGFKRCCHSKIVGVKYCG